MRRSIARIIVIMQKAKGKPIAPVLLFSEYRICNGLRKDVKKKVPKIKKIIKILATK
jgi:hypothetical protein